MRGDSDHTCVACFPPINFTKCQSIPRMQILNDDAGSSKGVGFINFSDGLCASRAVTALHNLPVGDRNLHVAFQTHRKT